MAYETITLEIDSIATLTINRPSKMNALNGQVIGELEAAFSELEAREDVRVLLVTGAGEKAFVAGADINELAATDAVSGAALARRGQRLLARLEAAAFATIAVVNGFALGGGMELAMACDVRIASEKAKMGLPEVTLGIIPGYAGTQRLAKIVGQGNALELVMTGKMIPASRAYEIGLVNQVAAPDELMATAQKMAGAIAKVGPLAVASAKSLVYSSEDVPFEQGCREEAGAFAILAATQDKAEGTAAFLEKRAASFEGR